VQKSQVWQKGKKFFYRKTEFLGTWKIFAKNRFSEKKSLGAT
jgi:hypothetical protein